MYIGCHVSIAGGVHKAPERAADLGCEAMQIFTRSPQGGKAPELTETIISEFRSNCKKHNIYETVVHTPYYINFASANNRIRYGSVSVVRDELERASLLGATYVMTHLGSAGELSVREASDKVIEMLTKTLDGYEGTTQLLIENSAGTGKIIGHDFAEIAYIIEKINHPKLAGICLDTQHSFASGYDWHEFSKTIEKIDKEIGVENIKLIHTNDSQTSCGSNRDRHEHIGKGLIGRDAFTDIVTFAKKHDITMILETEHDFVAEDIAIIKDLRT